MTGVSVFSLEPHPALITAKDKMDNVENTFMVGRDGMGGNEAFFIGFLPFADEFGNRIS
jgi:hypothetical protein